MKNPSDEEELDFGRVDLRLDLRLDLASGEEDFNGFECDSLMPEEEAWLKIPPDEEELEFERVDFFCVFFAIAGRWRLLGLTEKRKYVANCLELIFIMLNKILHTTLKNHETFSLPHLLLHHHHQKENHRRRHVVTVHYPLEVPSIA